MKQSQPHNLELVLNLPNTMTALRVLLSGAIFILLLKGEFLTGGILLLIAASTDWMDGLFARRLGQVTLGGTLFDLVADEMLFMPNLIAAVHMGLFSRADGLIPLNPYPYALSALAGGVTVIVGVGIYLWKQRTRQMEFPAPPMVAKLTFWFWLAPLIAAVLGIGPDWLLAVLMCLSIVWTVLAFYSYLKKGTYVFTD